RGLELLDSLLAVARVDFARQHCQGDRERSHHSIIPAQIFCHAATGRALVSEMRAFLLCLIACSSAKPATPEPKPAAPDPSPVAAAPPRAIPAGAVGDACKPDPANMQSTCGTGQLCFPAPRGYCTVLCGATGGAGPRRDTAL